MKDARGHLTEGAITHIRQVAQRRFAQLVLARFLLLNLFFEEAQNSPGGLQQKEHRRLWVLLQVQPNIFRKGDIFMDLTKHLRGATIQDLTSSIFVESSKYPTLRPKIRNPAIERHETPPFFCVLDEVQVTVSRPSGRLGEFMSSDKETKRFILREIWLSWSTTLGPQDMRLVLSGTRIDFHALNDTLASSACKEHPYEVVHDIGAFDTPEAQAKYIEPYLPIGDDDWQWEEFLKRAWAWLHGR